jgi:uroporphyrin-III C-methyltransferase/precorrin-2 dehydrogenase/sirohydrochlorin ferrochelatase
MNGDLPHDLPHGRRFLPLALDLRAKRCLVVGGGTIGTRKAITLAAAGAEVTVVSPRVGDPLCEQIKAGRISHVKDTFREEHLDGVFLVVAATDDDASNEVIARLGSQRGVLVCDASSADRSAVIFGALLDKEDVTVAVFTGGRDPARSRRTRDKISELLEED